MIAMQYSITLPADYDMDVVARRIQDKGPLMNGFPDLRFKAFLMARRDSNLCPSAANLYAPFYLWRRSEGMSDFLSGPGFARLGADFGRPAVTTWNVWHGLMPEALEKARFAARSLASIDPSADLAALRESEIRRAEDLVAAGAIAAVAAFDPAGWTLARFSFWRSPNQRRAEGTQLYEVGHVAEG